MPSAVTVKHGTRVRTDRTRPTCGSASDPRGAARGVAGGGVMIAAGQIGENVTTRASRCLLCRPHTLASGRGRGGRGDGPAQSLRQLDRFAALPPHCWADQNGKLTARPGSWHRAGRRRRHDRVTTARDIELPPEPTSRSSGCEGARIVAAFLSPQSKSVHCRFRFGREEGGASRRSTADELAGPVTRVADVLDHDVGRVIVEAANWRRSRRFGPSPPPLSRPRTARRARPDVRGPSHSTA